MSFAPQVVCHTVATCYCCCLVSSLHPCVLCTAAAYRYCLSSRCCGCCCLAVYENCSGKCLASLSLSISLSFSLSLSLSLLSTVFPLSLSRWAGPPGVQCPCLCADTRCSCGSYCCCCCCYSCCCCCCCCRLIELCPCQSHVLQPAVLMCACVSLGVCVCVCAVLHSPKSLINFSAQFLNTFLRFSIVFYYFIFIFHLQPQKLH